MGEEGLASRSLGFAHVYGHDLGAWGHVGGYPPVIQIEDALDHLALREFKDACLCALGYQHLHLVLRHLGVIDLGHAEGVDDEGRRPGEEADEGVEGEADRSKGPNDASGYALGSGQG